MTEEINTELQNVTSNLLQLITSLNQEKLNTIPFQGSWTAAQLADHVTKSNMGIAQLLNTAGKAVERKTDEKVEELRKTFLDFSTKMQSPAFIIPSQDIYAREELIENLRKANEQLANNGTKVNLSEAINHPAFGEITKLEMLHFVMYHTQRHIHQLKNIIQKVDEN